MRSKKYRKSYKKVKKNKKMKKSRRFGEYNGNDNQPQRKGIVVYFLDTMRSFINTKKEYVPFFLSIFITKYMNEIINLFVARINADKVVIKINQLKRDLDSLKENSSPGNMHVNKKANSLRYNNMVHLVLMGHKHTDERFINGLGDNDFRDYNIDKNFDMDELKSMLQEFEDKCYYDDIKDSKKLLYRVTDKEKILRNLDTMFKGY